MKRIPWNKGKKGLQVAWNKGLTKETDERVKKYSKSLSKSKKGWKMSDEQKENIRKALIGRIPWNKGIKTPECVKEKISKKLRGDKNPFYGKKHSFESKKRMSDSRKGGFLGKDNPRFLNLDRFKEEIIISYMQGYSSNYLAEKYNVSNVSILNYLERWDVKRRNSAFGFSGLIFCKDGHKVRSQYEVKIDNFLFDNGIEHETNGILVEGLPYSFDFYIPEIDLYIEYWGLERFDTYNKRKNKKLKQYNKWGCNLLSIGPKDSILDMLKFLIPLCAKKQRVLRDY